jgi:hypothetical protein
MPEPTIDDMIKWLDKTAMDAIMADRIRAILKAHREMRSVLQSTLTQENQQEAIRALLFPPPEKETNG